MNIGGVTMKRHRYIDISKLPKYRIEKEIDWSSSIDEEVYFEYDKIKGYLKIVGYDKLTNHLQIEYQGCSYEVLTNTFKTASFGRMLGVMSIDFKIKIGEVFKSDKRDLVVTDRRIKRDNMGRKWKYYKYRCNKCGYEGEREEKNMLTGSCCPICSNKKASKGINDIATTDPWMIEYLVDREDAYRHTKSSNKEVYVKCPHCGRIKNKKIRVYTLYSKRSIGCICSGGKSYAEKFMFNILEQLNVDFISEYSPDWIKPKRYDFYVPSKNLIIEMDGRLGHGNANPINKVSPSTSLEIDRYKDKQAIIQGLKVVRIKCNYKNNRFMFIKENILNSKCSIYLDLLNIDWDKANSFATDDLIKKYCEYYENHKEDKLLKNIAEELKINQNVLLNYIKIGDKLGWCKWKTKKRKIMVIETGDVFESISECVKYSKTLYGVHFQSGNISSVLNGNRKHHKEFSFKYVE